MTSAEELKQLREELSSAEEREDTTSVLKILTKLEDVTVSLETLKVRKKRRKGVGNLKKKFASNKKIVDLSKKLIADWKAACVPGTAGTPSKPTANPTTKQTPTKQTITKKVEEEEKKPETPTSDKKRKLSNTNFEEKKKPSSSPALTGAESERDKIRILITEALGEAEAEDVWEPTDAATTIEKLFTIFGSTNKDYKAKLRSLTFNLKKNSVLRRDVLNGSLTVDKLCRMTSAEMASEEEQKRRRDTEKWHMEAATIGKMEASTDQFLCGKCKNRKCTYYQLQTRSADEPMTTFVTCTVCNNRWKFC